MELKINVNKTKLLTSLVQNRATHIANFKEAMLGWQKNVKDIIISEANKLQITDDFSTIIQRTSPIFHLDLAPVSRKKDYDQAIEMLEYCSDTDITLEAHQFNAYVKDEWAWKEHWMVSNSKYFIAK